MERTLLLVIFCMWVPMNVLGRTGNTSVSSSAKKKVVNIGALFTLNSVIGRSAQPAIMAAVEDVNSDSGVLPETKLNLILHDTNCSGFLGTVEGIYFHKLLFLGLWSQIFLLAVVIDFINLEGDLLPLNLGSLIYQISFHFLFQFQFCIYCPLSPST